MNKNADLKEAYETLWKYYKNSNYDEKLIHLRDSILLSMKLCRRNDIENPRILFEFLLEIENKINGFDQGVLATKSPGGRPKDFLAKNKQRHAALGIEINILLGSKVNDACILVAEKLNLDAETIKRWRHRKPLDFSETKELYAKMARESRRSELLYALQMHYDLAK